MISGNGLFDVSSIFDGIIKVIFTIGNLVILCAAAFMGLRYVWSGVQGKSEIKESAMNMSVGVIFFYLAKGIYDLISKILKDMVGTGNFETMSKSIWANVAYVVKILAIIGFAATGVKYMLASANTKADLKKQLFPVIVGLIVIFCLTDVVNAIVNTAVDITGMDNVENVQDISGGQADATIKKTMDNLYATAAVVLQVLAVAAVVMAGVRYMFASADTRADIKGQTIVLIAGAVMTFGGMEIIKAIQKAGKQIIK